MVSDNPNFVATMSSDEIYYGQDLLTCLTDVVQAKAEADHTHNGVYAAVNHVHTDYASIADLEALEDVVNTKANANHTHSEYATANHSHDDIYYTETEIDTKLANKADTTHTHTGVYDVNGAAASALSSANAYTDSKIDALIGSGASTTLDTIGEISAAIEDNQDAIDLINNAIANKANNSDLTLHTGNASIHITEEEKTKLSGIAEGANNYTLPSAGSSLGGVKTGGDVTISNGVITVNDDSHNHVIANIDGLQDALDAKSASTHNHDSSYYTKTQVDTKDSDTLDSAKAYSDGLNTAMDSRMDSVETKLNTIASNAEVNQNAFSNVVVGSTTIAADSKTDSLTMDAGTGISISADATNDKVTITNAGVRSISTGSTNGTISVNTNGTSVNVAVKGLGSAAYTASTAYDSAGTAQTKADEALVAAKAYTDAAKNSLLNGAGAAYDTLKELGDLIDENVDAIDALEVVAASKANASDLTAHTSNNSNPHNVTLGQLGLTATAAELNKMDGVTATTAELNIMDGVTATTGEINYLDGVTSNIQTQLDGKASSSHTHSYAGSSSVGGAATSANKLNTNAGSATNPVYFANGVPVATTYTLGKSVPSNAVFTDTVYTLPAAGDALGGVKTGGDVAITNGTITVNDDSHNHVISNVDGLQTALDGKASSSHTHNAATTSANGFMTSTMVTKLNGIATGANKTTVDSALSSTSTNPVQNKVIKSALDNKISKDLQFIGDNGGCILSYNRADNKNLLTEILGFDVGFYTIYSQSGVTGNPKTTEAWRMMVHKTNATIGWVQAYGSEGSVYTGYYDGDNGWRGWRCLFDANPEPLWTGAMYMSSNNSTPQTVTPSKTLSQCCKGWVLVWSDYDPDTSTANDTDFVTTVIPKINPSGNKWSGQAFYCEIPRYIGSDPNDVDTERRIIKSIYIHDNCIKGSFNNNKSERNDVVLRSVMEY